VFDAATSYDLPGPITDLLLPLLFLASRANRFFYYGVGTSGKYYPSIYPAVESLRWIVCCFISTTREGAFDLMFMVETFVFICETYDNFDCLQAPGVDWSPLVTGLGFG